MFTYDEELFSDMYKDAFGIRPGAHRFYSEDTTPEEKQEIWDFVLRAMQSAYEEQKQQEENAIKEFEIRVQKCIQVGAKTRAEALKWIFDAEDDITMIEDKDYFCYTYGLPYGFFNKVENEF